MKYNELVVQEYEYTYSANIQFDLENDSKLARFIPNETTIGLLREFFTDIIKQSPSNHARILYGSYGTGKSHFLTVLSYILGTIHTDSIAFDTFIKRVNDFDKDLAIDIKEFIIEAKPFLIVPIVFDFENFNRCIYFSLRKVLEKEEIKVNLKSFYTYACELIEQWVSKNDSLKRLEEVCAKNKTTVNKLMDGLNAFNNQYEEIFKKVFNDMTFGVEFIHETSNLFENLDEVNKAIEQKYRGIVFIFDEFGRYLEDNIKKIKVRDVQDLAEYCDHSKYNNQIILISHKEISQYTTRYDETLINEWRKVEGRYKAIPINERYDQCLSLIKYIIPKNDNWHSFKDRYSKELNDLYNEAWDFKGFLTTTDQQGNPFEGGYPIHPIALFALDRMSKKVAQNERTFFTFLAGKEDNSLYSFLQTTNTDSFHFLGIDKIYEYFEPNLKSIRSSYEYETYRRLQTAISKCESKQPNNNTCYKVLRTIAAINIIADYGVLPASNRILLGVIDEPKSSIENAIEWLNSNKIIKFSRHYGYYEFFDSSIFDVDEMVMSKINDINDEMVIRTLNNEFIDFVLYPYKYNELYKIKRIYIPMFTSIEDLEKVSFVKNAPDYYDGILALALGNKDITKENIPQNINKLQRVIVLINNNSTTLLEEVKKYIAIKYFESNSEELSKEDPIIINELKYYREEQIEMIRSLVDSWRNIEDVNIIVLCDGRIESISNLTELQDLANRKMLEYYPYTLIVNNELINKNLITGAMNVARKSVVDKILTEETEEAYFGLTVLSPEYTSLRSTLALNKILIDDKIEKINSLPDGMQTTDRVIVVIRKYIDEIKNNSCSFLDIYNELKEQPYGLRDGYLPILISYLLRPYRNSLVITSHGVEQELTAETFIDMLRRPKDFKLLITVWNKDKTEFISCIEDIFKPYISLLSQKKNRLKALYEALISHYKSISKFSRSSDMFVSEKAKIYRKLLEKNVESFTKFFFVDLKAIGGSYSATVELIKFIKEELESLSNRTCDSLVQDIKQIFLLNENSLAHSLSEMYDTNWKVNRKRQYDFYTNAWIDFTSKLNKEEFDYDIVYHLSRVFTGFEIDYWNDHHKEDFVQKLIEVKRKLDSYQEKDVLTEKDVKVTLQTLNGTPKSVIFENGKLDELGLTLKNKIFSMMTNNFGQSIKYGDRIKVVLKLLEELIDSNSKWGT